MPNQDRNAYKSTNGNRSTEQQAKIMWTRRFTPEHSITCTRHYKYTNNTYNGCYEISIEAESQTHTYIFFDREDAKEFYDTACDSHHNIYERIW